MFAFQDAKANLEDKVKHKVSDSPDKGTKKSPKNVTLPPADSKSKIQNKNVSNENKKDKSEKTDKVEKTEKEKTEKSDKVDNKYDKLEKQEKTEKLSETNEKDKHKERIKDEDQEKESASKGNIEQNEKSDDNRMDSVLDSKERTESKQEFQSKQEFAKDKGDLKDKDKYEKFDKYDKSEDSDDVKEDKRDSSLSFKDSSTIPPIHSVGHNISSTSSNLPPSIPSLSRYVDQFSSKYRPAHDVLVFIAYAKRRGVEIVKFSTCPRTSKWP